MTFTTKWMLVAASVALADICWTLYFIEVEKRAAIKAGFWSAMIMVMGTFATSSYVSDHRFIAAAVAGAFVGTAGVVAWKRRNP